MVNPAFFAMRPGPASASFWREVGGELRALPRSKRAPLQHVVNAKLKAKPSGITVALYPKVGPEVR